MTKKPSPPTSQTPRRPKKRPDPKAIGLAVKGSAASSAGDPMQAIGAQRQLTTQLKTARKRTNSSARWLNRQLNDPFVAEAKRQGYRSRAAFKLVGLDDRFGFLRPGARVLDLGCAPGGWLQVAVQRTGADQDDAKAERGRVLGIDLQAVEPVPGASIWQGDMRDEATQAWVVEQAGGKLDAVISDMAAPSTGHAQTDHLRVMMLIDIAFDVAEQLLAPGGTFVAKVLQGGAQKQTLDRLKQAFTKVQTVKPDASRSDSREQFIVAQGFRG
jgi:23S rRNA (uridine2552-2'-O)-methyltransferase